MRWPISLCLMLCGSIQAAYVVNNAGRKISGPEISAAADGRVTLKTAGGQVMTFQKGQYRSAAADRPTELDIAEKLLRDGQGGKAVPYLQRAKEKCRFLQWDQTAIQLLADYYYESGQYALAVREYQQLEDPSIPQNQNRLRDALMRSGELDAALQVLNADISSGSRAAAAQAYVMRGKLKAENGDAAGAKRDWMKVTTFFKAQEDAVTEAENLLKENEL